MFCSLALVGSKHPNLCRGMEGVAQKPVGVQLQQPLAFLHITLASGQVLGVPRIDQIDLEATLFQNLVERNPIDPRRLHGHGLDSTTFSQSARRCRSAVKQSDLSTGSSSRSGRTAT